MVDHPRQLSVADATLIRSVLIFYEEHLIQCRRVGEEDEVNVAVVQTLETLRRLYHRLSNWVMAVDEALDDGRTGSQADDDPPF